MYIMYMYDAYIYFFTNMMHIIIVYVYSCRYLIYAIIFSVSSLFVVISSEFEKPAPKFKILAAREI